MVYFKLKLPAIAVDNDGNEQAVEVEMKVYAKSYSIQEGTVKGYGYLAADDQINFSFVEEHTFRA